MDPSYFTRLDLFKLQDHSKNKPGGLRKNEVRFSDQRSIEDIFYLPGDVDVNKSQFHHLRGPLRLFCNAVSAKRKETKTNRKIRETQITEQVNSSR